MATTPKSRAQAIFELIRIKGSDLYKNLVPSLADSDPISKVGTPILQNPNVFKEFSDLLGVLMETRVWRDSWQNPLGDMVRSGGSPLGEYSRDIANNPIMPRKYDPTHPERVLQYAINEDKVAYYVRNVKELFKVSIPYQDMQGAFSSYDKFDEYVSMKLATLTSGQQISSYNHIMEAIVTNYNAGLFHESNVHITPGTSENYADWTTEVKNLVDHFQWPSSNYNGYGRLESSNGDFIGYSKPDDIYIIGTIEWLNETTVNFLASLFNLSQAEIRQRIIKVPSFSYTYYTEEGSGAEETTPVPTVVTSPIQCMVIDRRALNFREDLHIDESDYNKQTLVNNFYKHWWATYSVSPFGNAVVFTESGSAITNIGVADYGNKDGERIIDIKTASGTQTLTMWSTPENDTGLGAVTFTVSEIIKNFDTPVDISTLNASLSDYLTVPTTDSSTPNQYKFTGINAESTNHADVILTMTFTAQGNKTVPVLATLYHS